MAGDIVRTGALERTLRVFAFAVLLSVPIAICANDRGWRVQGELILPGDSMAKVVRVAGAPDLRNRIESEHGGTVGNRWYYMFEGYDARTVIITFHGGRVADIRTERN